jgi:hypothetical protein
MRRRSSSASIAGRGDLPPGAGDAADDRPCRRHVADLCLGRAVLHRARRAHAVAVVPADRDLDQQEPDWPRCAEGRARPSSTSIPCSAAPSRTRSTRFRRCSALGGSTPYGRSQRGSRAARHEPGRWGNGKPAPPAPRRQIPRTLPPIIRRRTRPRDQQSRLPARRSEVRGHRERHVVFRLWRRVRQCRQLRRRDRAWRLQGHAGARQDHQRLAGDAGAARLVPRRRDNTPVGLWTDMHEDTKGLVVEGKLAPTPRGQELYR